MVQGYILDMEFYYVYILLSLKDSNFYSGFTKDVFKRFDEHQKGKNVSTKNRRPFELIYFEAHRSKDDALRREKYFKSSKGKTTLKQILKESLKGVPCTRTQ